MLPYNPILSALKNGRMKRKLPPAPRFELKERYDKGWVPGPNAEWARKSPNELARSLKRPEQHREQKEEHKTPATVPDEQTAAKKTTQLAPAATPAAKPADKPPEVAKSPTAEPTAAKPAEQPKEQAKPLRSPDEMAGELAPKLTPQQAKFYFDGLTMARTKGGNTYPVPAIMAAKKIVGENDPRFDDLAQEATIRIYEQASKFQPIKGGSPEDNQKKFAGFANTVAHRQAQNERRKEDTQKKHVGELPSNVDVAGKPASSGVSDDLHEAIGKISDPMERQAAELMATGNVSNHRDLAKKLGMNETAAYKLRNRVYEFLQGEMGEYQASGEKTRHDEPKEKTRYIYGPVIPAVWTEIIKQSHQYGDLAPEFVRCVMQAMEQSDSQWQAIVDGRHQFMNRSQRYEYGPRHQPPKRIEGAVARLEALRDHGDDIPEEALADEVEGIAREFDADELKQIARDFGIDTGLGTKAITVMKIFQEVCGKKKKRKAA